MFKFNNGNGAIICDRCKKIIRAPAKESDANPKGDYCKGCIDIENLFPEENPYTHRSYGG